MTSLSTRVGVAQRFRRSIRIDADIATGDALSGFVCPPSSAAALQSMAQHVSETGQSAFTWTGPYGSGKSSLAVALAACLSQGDSTAAAAGSLGRATHSAIRLALPPGEQGWRVLPVVGRRGKPAQAVGDALERHRFVRGTVGRPWDDDYALASVVRVSKRAPRKHGGLLLLIDEMGKFLEGAARDGEDIFFFQQLAELASRSNGRLIVVCILHQAFEEYANRLSRGMRDEWAKVQGRFIDLTIVAAPDEQVEILGRAIESESPPAPFGDLARRVAGLTGKSILGDALKACWPLHPVVSSLLGPISRRRFGQNQRSVFGFLNSAEPLGFQDFLRHASDEDLYTPDLLWDYLRFNLEPSILASPDGHRWALAVDAVNRCEAAGADELRQCLLKTIAIVDLFRERSGLVASPELLRHVVLRESEGEIENALQDLCNLSLVIYRRFNDSLSVFAGSDFDIEQAVEDAYEAVGRLDHKRLTELAGLPPVIAKRHYHETGALRWYDFAVAAPTELSDAIDMVNLATGSSGAFVLTLPTQEDAPKLVERHVENALALCGDNNLAVGLTQRGSWDVLSLARDLVALEHVRDHTPLLQGDQVARLEVEARIAALREQLEYAFGQALGDANWWTPRRQAGVLDRSQLSVLASELSDEQYPDVPRVQNELLNRVKPSSNAVAAQNVLLANMVLNEGVERLGIKEFPAEGGLFVSLLESTGLYRQMNQDWCFAPPDEFDPSNLGPAWGAAEELLTSNAGRSVSVSEVWQAWREPPFGIKDGLMPILTAAFILSMRHKVAIYRDGIFQSCVGDLDMHVMARNPDNVQLRWMVLSDHDRSLLSDLADIVRALDDDNPLADLEPIDVARGLIGIHDRLHGWTKRSQRLSADARRLRHLFRRANDPNKLLFDDIPRAFCSDRDPTIAVGATTVTSSVDEALRELLQAYPSMLNRQQESLLSELQVPNASAPMLAELRCRAENVRGLSADHRQEAFVVRLAQFSGAKRDIEGLISLAVSKPPANWTDTDTDGAAVALAEMARDFVGREAFAHVKGRSDKRHAIAVIVGVNGRRAPLHQEFDVSDIERPTIELLVDRLEESITGCEGLTDRLVLAALAELSAKRIPAK
jgi:hypothetical protein